MNMNKLALTSFLTLTGFATYSQMTVRPAHIKDLDIIIENNDTTLIKTLSNGAQTKFINVNNSQNTNLVDTIYLITPDYQQIKFTREQQEDYIGNTQIKDIFASSDKTYQKNIETYTKNKAERHKALEDFMIKNSKHKYDRKHSLIGNYPTAYNPRKRRT